MRVDAEDDRHLEGEDPDTEDYSEIEGWAEVYAELGALPAPLRLLEAA